MNNANLTMSSTSSEYRRIYELQKTNLQAIANSSAKQRIDKLQKLGKSIEKHKAEIRTALFDDFRKHPSEVDLTEIYPVTTELKHALAHLKSWMKDEHVSTPLALFGTSSWIKYEPKGNVLIISPWNFPVNLTFIPLISAVAAGNCVIIKPSENTPHASAIMRKIVSEVFEENEVALFEGGIEASTGLLELPFNHIFFTGAPSIGKIVMAAAAKNLASVTLELGGKSPTIVEESADLKAAARRIAWAKFLNNGQICIAPDYLYVHESVKSELKRLIIENLKSMYGSEVSTSDSYCRIVNDRHFHRLSSYLKDGIESEMDINLGGQTDESQRYIAPTLVENASEDSDLMDNEIFGPILPIFTYKDLNDVVEAINKKEKPLAIYIYSKNKNNVNFVINNTRAGGTCINHSALHYFNSNLPFGGVNNSGIGKAHGQFGFKEFSNARGILKQWGPMSAIEMMMPPYTDFKQKLIDLSIKWF